MKPMLLAFFAIVVISFGASWILNGQGLSAQDRATGNSVRLD